MVTYYTATSLISIVTLLILDCLICKNDVLTRKGRRFFRLAVYAAVISISSEMVLFSQLDSSPRWLKILVCVVGFSISAFIPLFIGRAINNKLDKIYNCLCVPAFINIVFTVLSARYGLIFSVSPEGVYSRGPFFWVLVVSYGAGIASILWETLILAHRHQNKGRQVLFFLFLFIIALIGHQIFVPGLRLWCLCIAISMSLYYAYCCELNQQVDGLTFLLNRSSYDTRIQMLNNKKNAYILIFDIDEFKNINDCYGHHFGDYCLSCISTCLRETFSHIGQCYRIGGDEFCVISEKASKNAVGKAQRSFLQKIDTLRTTESRLPMVSVGCAYYDKSEGGIGNAISEADKQMYFFKQLRKGESSPSVSSTNKQ